MCFFLRIRAVLILLLASVTLLSPGTEALGKENKPLIMGVFPRHNPTITIEMFQPFVDHLSTSIDREIKLEASKDFETFWQNVALERYDIVHYNQLHYIQSHEKFSYDVIAVNQEYGENTISSGILVRKDSGIEKLADLKGKKIVFGGDAKAMVAYIGNKILLKQAGLSDGDYVEEFSKNPPNAIFAVFHKQVDAAGTGNGALKRSATKERIDTDQLKFIALGEPIPHLPWAAHRRLGADFQVNLQNALLTLNDTENGKKLLANAQMTAILKATDDQFNVCRKILKQYDFKF